jgi:hypothetical protein
MAKYYGMIGFGKTVEVDPENRPGVYEVAIEEHPYYGDILSNNRRYERGGGLNDDLAVRNEFSILADAYANENFHNIK